MDGYSGTGTTAVAVIHSPIPCEFIGSESDKKCHQLAFTRIKKELCQAIVANKYAVLDEPAKMSQATQSIINQIGFDVLRSSASVVLADFKSKESAKELKKSSLNMMWTPPLSFPSFTTLPLDSIAAYFSIIGARKNPSTVSESTLDVWENELQGAIPTIPLDIRRGLQRVANKVERVFPSENIPSAQASFMRGIVTLSPHEEGSVITTIHGHLVYDDVRTTTTTTKTYGRNSIKLSVDHFREFSRKVPLSNVMYEERLYKYAYFVPAMEHIVSQCRLVPMEAANAYVKFPTIEVSLADLAKHTSYQLIAKTDIPVGVEILIAE